MYIGRFVVVGPGIGAYRVSSRSFPNRQIRNREGTLTVGPTPDAPETDNPYVSYNCVRTATPPGDRESVGIVGNGSHVDPIAEKIDMGYPARDALALSLLSLDFEKDDYNTPRIAGVVTEADATISIVRHDALVVKTVTEPTLVATYEHDSPRSYDFEAADATEAASEVYEAAFEHAVCAAGVTVDADSVEMAIEN